ncbi:MAG: arginine N-succinyltransferase [Inhella sp.]|jgi:arginine N-succinyltransferase|uniref:arginine N-succinyltransferase n=1 Tax=Inhella sp. TaxID=1921806 RepID=UPI0022C1DC96|nr:arginine N-succinyltransferase [Inhella sp.]MCZ8233548.1 arginine N-succinyltransferase [Inhella sp.]
MTSEPTLCLRPVRRDDLDGLQRLAAGASPGIGSLRNDAAWLAQRIEHSLQAFATDDDEVSGEERYLFVLHDEATDRLVGCSGITARAGYGSRFYSYRNEFVVASSAGLGITQRTHTLHLCHDLTGTTLLTSFYIEPEWAEGAAPQLLSRGRLLFIRQFSQRFSDRIVAEHPGWLDAQRNSPFWDAVGRRFFAMDYPQAEALAGGRSKAFIAELMPTSPVYVPLLPEAAQRAIGQLHPDGELPFAILQDEGFDAETYIDLFDGGPITEGRLHALGSVRAARARTPRAEPVPVIACHGRREGFEARVLWGTAPATWGEGGLITPLERDEA